MKKIAILGCENSHANAFLNFIRDKEEFADIEVVGVYSDDTTAAEKLNQIYGVPVMQSYTDAVGKIDGLIVTARHGDNHYKFAKPYIESRIPMFIDKPVTIKEEEAVEFVRLLKENCIRVCGGSSLKHDEFIKKLKDDSLTEQGGKTVGGYVRAPYISENEYGGFYFYSQHLVEMVCEIFGGFPRSVTAKKNGKQIHVLFHYDDYDGVGVFCDQSSVYYASRMSETDATSYMIPFTEDWFYGEFNEFYSILSGNEQAVGYDRFVSPVFIMNAIMRSLDSGKEEMVGRPEI